MEAKTSLDMELVKFWAEKYPEFQKRKPELILEYVAKHDAQTASYYCDLFLASVMQYHKTKNMQTPQELQRFVAHGALVSYAAKKILDGNN